MKKRDKVFLFSVAFTISIYLNVKYIFNVDIPFISMLIAIVISYPILRWFNKKGYLVIKENGIKKVN